MARQGNSGSRRGFASMDKDKQRAIASKGGRAAHEKGTAHEFTPEEAKIAGRKGGEAGGSATRSRPSVAPSMQRTSGTKAATGSSSIPPEHNG